MEKIRLLRVSEGDSLFVDLAKALPEYKENAPGSYLFIVEGTLEKPIIGIKYPGKKLRRRTELTRINKNSCLWANLLDFEVVIFQDGKRVDGNEFTFQNMLKDFNEDKMQNKEFWQNVTEIYVHNRIGGKIPKLSGIDSKTYLYALKWIWIQEDLNYRFKWDEVSCPIKYRLENRTGTTTARGAGRAKFYAALILLRNGFTFDQVRKIIPLY